MLKYLHVRFKYVNGKRRLAGHIIFYFKLKQKCVPQFNRSQFEKKNAQSDRVNLFKL